MLLWLALLKKFMTLALICAKIRQQFVLVVESSLTGVAEQRRLTTQANLLGHTVIAVRHYPGIWEVLGK